jgi:hypothetical protein
VKANQAFCATGINIAQLGSLCLHFTDADKKYPAKDNKMDPIKWTVEK